MPEYIAGLPLHPLVVHATVVLVPLTALLVLAGSLVLRVRAWAGWLPTAMAATCVVLSLLSTSSGQTLQGKIGEAGSSAPVLGHAALGDMLIWWTLGLLVVAAASYALRRTGRDRVRGVAVTLAVLGVLVPVGAAVQTVLVGHSGAKAVWGYLADQPTG